MTRIRKNTIKKVQWTRLKNYDLKLKGKDPISYSYRDIKAFEQMFWKTFVSKKQYGLRSGIEGVIGSFKRFFGECVCSKIKCNIENELRIRCNVWNLMLI
ncbi:MAG: hypothetical protein KAI53_02580 [Candidatus Aenigmarchaeota archaeon]|nr:hypothetical protein [Candidatus Aenigmarchaeota archaeon]